MSSIERPWLSPYRASGHLVRTDSPEPRITRSRGSNRLGHALDIVETICALAPANGDPRHNSPVQLWLDEPNAAAVLGTPPYPDSVVALEAEGGSGVICLEI
jgi:hypothetical protein